MAASVRFTGEGSPSRARVDEASLNGTSALPAMGMVQRGGEEESKKIKNEGEDERMKRGSFKGKIGRKLPFCSLACMEIKKGRLRDFKYEI